MTTPNERPLDEPAPIQPTNGAGTMPDDPDQAGVSQEPAPDLDEAEHAALLATAGGLTAHTILTWEASQIGTGEHPPGSNHTIYSLWGDGAWCFYFQSFGFRKYNALGLIFGAHGYVPDFKGIFQPHGEFHTSNPKPGDLVAFDFNRSGEPEHIGMVEKVISGSVIQTIEGNTSDKVMRRTRSRSYVYGYATPKYAAAAPPKPIPATAPSGSPILKKGSSGSRVTQLQKALNTTRTKKITVDSKYGSQTAKAVSEFQAHHGLKADGEYGTKTAAALKKVTG